MTPEPTPARLHNSFGNDRAVVVLRQERGHECGSQRHAATHDNLVIAFCTRGYVTIEQQGTWTLRAGDALLIPAGAAHRHIDAHDAEIWCLGLSPVCFRAEGGAELLEPLERVRSGAAAVVNIPEPRRALLVALYTELQRETDDATQGTSTAQRSLVSLILTEVGRAMASRSEPAPSSSVVAE